MARGRLLAASLVALAPSTALAHEPWTYGFGSRPAAMGGAVAADTTDFSANYYNPAGLAGDTGLRLSIGYEYAINNLYANDRDSGVDPVHGLAFGVAAGGKVFGLFPLAIGIAAHIPDDGLSRVTALREGVPRWELYDSRAAVLFLTANAAIRPVDWLELGGGVSFLAATEGRFEITGTAKALSPFDSHLRHQVDANLTSVRYPEAGLRFHLGRGADVALVYRHETKLELSLDALLHGDIDFGGIGVPLTYTLESRTVAAFLPAQLVVGTSLHPVKDLHVNADLSYVHWSGYDSPTAKTTASLRAKPPPEVAVDLPADVQPTTPIPPAFEDRVVPRLGVEWFVPGLDERAFARVALRAGYVFEMSPVPPQSGLTNFMDADRHTFSFGAGAVMRQPNVSLDLHFAYSHLPERITLKKDPADLVGDYRQRGEMLSFGATLGAGFR
ncbi:MAG: outer membrane protein transport protein [Polyangiaceae bacterium]